MVLASADPVPTLIFDEVDAGVGGAVAAAVGERLSRLARDVQVLVVTHSPQVAARGDHHWRIAKTVGETQARTAVEVLDPPGRKEEIARMLAGARVTAGSARRGGEPARGFAGVNGGPAPARRRGSDGGASGRGTGGARHRDRRARPRLLSAGRARSSATPSTTRCAGATRRSRRAFPSSSARIRRQQGGRAGGRPAFAKVAHARPMLRLANAFPRRKWSSSSSASGASSELRDDPALAGDDGRAEDRRAAVSLRYEEGRWSSAPPAATAHRRGRHRQPAHDHGHPATGSPARRRSARCAARSTCPTPTSPR